VGRSTVSRVLNDDPRVRPETRERVLEIVRQEHYQPNVIARSLASGKSNVIGAVIPTAVETIFDDPYFPMLIAGISAACARAEALLLLWVAEPEYERRMIDKVIRSGAVGGVVVWGGAIDDPLVTEIIASARPFVLLGRHPHDSASYIDVDQVSGARGAVGHLVRSGRKRVATITGPQDTTAALDRYAGYRRGLEDAGFVEESELVAEGQWTELSGYNAMLQLLPAKPDAVFAANDTMALGALRALRESGLSVPGDVAIVGFDDIPAAAVAPPPLTTVRQPVRQIGELAARTLLELIDQPESAPRRIVVPTELVVRASCGANADPR